MYVKQAGTFGPLLQSTPCLAMTYGMKQYVKDVFFGDICIEYTEHHSRVYYDQEITTKVGDWYFEKAIRDFSSIQKSYEEWSSAIHELESLGKELLDTGTEESLRGLYDLFLKLWSESFFVEAYDEDYEKRIYQFCKKQGYTVTHEELLLLTQPDYISIPLQFEKDLVDTLLGESKTLEDISQEYYFYDVGYLTGNSIDVEAHVKHLEYEGVRNAQQRIQAVLREQNSSQEKKQALVEHNKYNEDCKNAFNFFSLLVEWRDVRKKMHQIGSYYIYQYVCTRLGISTDLAPYATVNDILNNLHISKDYKSILQQRRERVLLTITSDGTYDWLYDSDDIEQQIHTLEPPVEDLQSITGNIAYKGLVIGKVVVVNALKDFEKMEENAVLVAPMTRPEYVPLMKKASAIITDEGGITSHAAIVSRELKKPCIIGTKIATQVFKDGDVVEVDANEGIVRKLG